MLLKNTQGSAFYSVIYIHKSHTYQLVYMCTHISCTSTTCIARGRIAAILSPGEVNMNVCFSAAITLASTLLLGCTSESVDATQKEPLRPIDIREKPTPTESGETSFGHRQLKQMLDDRPDMKGVVPPTHPVVAWLVDGFNGERFGQRIYWNANAPQIGQWAEYNPPYAQYPPFISISGNTISPIDKWAAAVFEMFNIENSVEFVLLTAEATEGTLDVDSFASKCVELELQALWKTHLYFRDNPLPKPKNGRDRWYVWATSDDVSIFEDDRSKFDKINKYSVNHNIEYYKKYYETVIVPCRSSSAERE